MVKLAVESRLAKEFQRVLPDLIPATWSWRLDHAERRDASDLVVHLAGPDGSTSALNVEMKTRITPAEIVRQIPWYKQRGEWLLASPFVGPRSRQILEQGGISWLELLSGECRIAIGGLFVERSSRRSRRSIAIGISEGRTDLESYLRQGPRYVRDLFAGKALRITRWLLISPSRTWTLADMSRKAGASVGFVSRTLGTLTRDAFVERRKAGWYVRDRDGLLDGWAAAPVPREERLERVSLAASPAAIISALKSTRIGTRYAFTAEAAAEQIAPFARFSRIEIYSEGLGEWDSALQLTPVPRGGNVVLILSEDRGVFDGAINVRGLSIVSRPQLYVDLKRRGGSAADAADFLRGQGQLWPN